MRSLFVLYSACKICLRAFAAKAEGGIARLRCSLVAVEIRLSAPGKGRKARVVAVPGVAE